MPFKNWAIGARLGSGFGLVFVLMLGLLGVGGAGFRAVSVLSTMLFEVDSVTASLTNRIDLTTRDNARLSLELLIVKDAARLNKINEQIDGNKKTITDALLKLKALETEPANVAEFARLTEARVAYVTSFTQVRKLAAEGRLEEASVLMESETLGRLEALQDPISALSVKHQETTTNEARKLKSSIDNSIRAMLGFGFLAILLGAVAAVLITRSVTQPLQEATYLSKRVASGDLTSVVVVDRRDESGVLLGSLDQMQTNLVQVVEEVRLGSDAVSTASAEIAFGNNELAARTVAHASTLEQTAASVEQLSAAVQLNADNAQQANQLAIAACEIAERGGQVVSQVVNTMRGINDSSRKIYEIISVIDSIAFQTNILALNAAVEAARAGEHGRGFAVVAMEVRSLAGRSAEAAKEIKSLINSSVESVEFGTTLVGNAGSTMDEVVQSIRRVTALIGEISTASHEQALGVSQVGQSIVHMDEVTQKNAELVEEMAAAAAHLNTQATALVASVGFFNIGR